MASTTTTTTTTRTNVAESVKSWGINEQLANNLIEDGVDTFYPVQHDVVPMLLRYNARGCIQTRDICVSAPTGSGKTIAYALPVVNTLLKETSVRLRALVMLPSRELANQVYSVFCRLARGTKLKVAISTGQTSFAEESQMLQGNSIYSFADSAADDVGNKGSFSTASLYDRPIGPAGRSAVDVLICTPGRLLEHIQQTPGFSLQHLRFLVLDEADRLLGNAYHSWVRTLMQRSSSALAAMSASSSSSSFSSFVPLNGVVDEPYTADNKRSSSKRRKLGGSGDVCDSLASAASSTVQYQKEVEWSDLSYLEFMPKQPLQRLLFSASLTDNPSKLSMLGVQNPILIHSQPAGAAVSSQIGAAGDTGAGRSGDISSIVLPLGLSESQITCDTQDRLMNLIAILCEAFGVYQTDSSNYSANTALATREKHRSVCTASRSGHNIHNSSGCVRDTEMCIVFASSVETTHKLCRLLQLINGQIGSKAVSSNNGGKYLFGGRVEEMSRLMGIEERERHMMDAGAGKISVLVSSDQLARGIDLPNIRLVVNYDPPKFAKAYLHRAGRTARGDLDGHCITMLKVGQVGSFRSVRLAIGEGKLPEGKKALADAFNELVPKVHINSKTKTSLETIYQACLRELPKYL